MERAASIILQAILARYVDIDEIVFFVNLKMAMNLEDITPREARKETATAVVRYFHDENRLLELAQKLRAESANNQNVLDFLSQAFEILEHENFQDPHNALLARRRAFVNRDDFRQLMAPGAFDYVSVILMRGEQYAGTSFCKHLIMQVAESRVEVRPCYYDCDGAFGNDPYQMAQSIMGKLKLPAPETPLDGANWNRVASQCHPFMIGQIRDAPFESWIIIDNLQRETVPHETVGLVRALIDSTLLGETGGKLKLFILGCCDKIPQDYDPAREEMYIPYLKKEDVRTYLESLSNQYGLESEESLDELMDLVWPDAYGEPISSIEDGNAMSAALDKIARRHTEEQAGGA